MGVGGEEVGEDRISSIRVRERERERERVEGPRGIAASLTPSEQPQVEPIRNSHWSRVSTTAPIRGRTRYHTYRYQNNRVVLTWLINTVLPR